ncbi:MAG: Coenzyme F420 hydrogenase/dehydrogenase, beta subunit C-terminal domain, partial [Euryarchaeota archaeon]|nr:Coenzyme F420 hydrogenase/dehydrogenase, beta subunit C-terminal domain [Euryarchaeota archaeon]
YYKKILAVRSKIPEILEKAQDGGAVTSLLLCALENKLIDGAVVATRFNNWDTSPIIAKSKEELLQAAGTKYTRTATSMKLGRSLQELSRLALVGTGCQITGARKTQISFLKNLLEITSESENPLDFLLIGLFCFENFPYDGLRRTIESKFNIQMDQIIKTDIKKGKFIVYTKNGQVEKSVKAFEECVPESCKLCCNFTAEFSDISVGSVGTPAGWSTVIVRTQKGINLLTKAEELGYVEVEKRVELNEIKKNVSLKKEKRKVVSELRGKEGKYVPYYT